MKLEVLENFTFNQENKQKVEHILKKYPVEHRQSAVLPLLDLAQRQNEGWLSFQALEAVAKILDMPTIKVHEVASFYTMFNLDPIGKNLVQVCTTTPCWLRGSDKIVQACEKELGLKPGESNKNFTVMEVECLGACVNAPIVQINDDFYEDLSEASISELLQNISKGKSLNIGSQMNRLGSSPKEGMTVLLNTLNEIQTLQPEKKTIKRLKVSIDVDQNLIHTKSEDNAASLDVKPKAKRTVKKKE